MIHRILIALAVLVLAFAAACGEEDPRSPREQVEDGITTALQLTVPAPAQHPFEITPHGTAGDVFDVVMPLSIFAVNDAGLRNLNALRDTMLQTTAIIMWRHRDEDIEPFLATTRYEWYDPETGERVMVIEMDAETRRGNTWVFFGRDFLELHDNWRLIPELANQFEDHLTAEQLENAIAAHQLQ